MSELVKKVEHAIDYQIQNHGYGPHVSRAAITAVAEWLSEDPDAKQCCVAALVLNEQLEQPK